MNKTRQLMIKRYREADAGENNEETAAEGADEAVKLKIINLKKKRSIDLQNISSVWQTVFPVTKFFKTVTSIATNWLKY